jgi:hypothetical protein
VLVVANLAGPESGRGRRRRTSSASEDVREVPVTRVTAAPPDRFSGEGEARAWLKAIADDRDGDLAEAEIRRGTRLANRAVDAQRTATWDPNLPDVSAEHALAVRIGWGTGDQIADSRWSEAIEIPADRRSRRRDTIAPQERIAATLAHGGSIDACEALLLRARADLDADRPREAALQLRVGLEALLAEVAPTAGPEQAADVAELEGRQARIAGIAHEALEGSPHADAVGELEEALRLGERVLRRRRILGE